MDCIHNARCRFTHGFLCEDCDTFFAKDSPVYRAGELLSSLWLALNNINAERLQRGELRAADVAAMRDKIGIGVKHDNYEQLITEAEQVLSRYGRNADSASVTLYV